MRIEWENVSVKLWGVLEERMFCLVTENDGDVQFENCVE